MLKPLAGTNPFQPDVVVRVFLWHMFAVRVFIFPFVFGSLFELHTAIECGCDVHMVFDPKQAEVFRTTHFDFSSVIADINAENAQASVASDKQLLMNQIVATTGVAPFNEKIRRFMETALQAEVITQTMLTTRGAPADVHKAKVRGYNTAADHMSMGAIKQQIKESVHSEFKEQREIMQSIKTMLVKEVHELLTRHSATDCS